MTYGIAGGARIFAKVGASTLESTAGIVIQNRADFLMITAGHGVGATHSIVYDKDNKEIGKVETNFYRDNTNVDLAIVKMLTSYRDFGAYCIQLPKSYNSKYENVIIPDEAGRPAAGGFVILISPTRGASFGRIIHSDVDVNAPEGRVSHVCVADYDSLPSDSGAPVVSGLQEGAILFGIHGGIFTSDGLIRRWFTPLDNIEI